MPDIDKLLNAIDAAEETAYGGDFDGDLQHERALAIQYYQGRNVEPAPEGRSQVNDRSVFEVVQWMLPSLCRIFANGDNVVEFAPVGPEDEEPAQQESDYLNYLVTQKNPWFEICLTWFQDALLSKNGYCLAFMDETLHTESETYERQSDEAMTLLLQDEGVEVVEHESYPDPDAQPQPMLDQVQPSLNDITIRRTKAVKKLCFRVLPPENCRVSQETPSFSLIDGDYFEYYDYPTISSLRAMGYDVPDDIASDGEQADSEVEQARDRYLERDLVREASPVDAAQKRVKARTVWIRHDYNEDGISELVRVVRVGRKILAKKDEPEKPIIEEYSRIPVASIVPITQAHRHPGMAIADITVDIQRIKTAILRQGLDNLYLANNPRHVVSSKVNLDDMDISRPGAKIRLYDDALPAEGHVQELVAANVFPQAMQALEFMGQVTEGRTGVSRFSTGVDPDVLSKSPSGVAVNQLSTMAAQQIEQIARIFASGVEYLFSIAHELILKSGHKGETVKLRGRWMEVNPSQWRTGRDMRIVVGYGAGNKDALVGRLMTILNAQKEAMQGGLRVASEENVYEALVELTKASDFSAPERFWTDPRSLPPPPPPKPTTDEVYAQVEGEKVQSQERVKQAELAQKDQEGQRKTENDRYVADLRAQVDVLVEQIRQGGQVDLTTLKAQLDNAPIEIENQKLDQVAQVMAAIADSQARQTQDFGDMLSSLATRLEDAMAVLHAPRELVRDKSGKVTGVRVNGKERKLTRDERGQVSGLQ